MYIERLVQYGSFYASSTTRGFIFTDSPRNYQSYFEPVEPAPRKKNARARAPGERVYNKKDDERERERGKLELAERGTLYTYRADFFQMRARTFAYVIPISSRRRPQC